MNCIAIIFLTISGTASAGRNFRPLAAEGGSSLVKPLKFNQKLLLCNAYSSKSPVEVSKNGQPVLASNVGNLGFQQCEYAPTSILAKDKLDFTLTDAGIEGTFEVGDLPQTDSVLLLVLQKRDAHSPLMAFQSFAFPLNSGRDEAPVAVIDASPAGGKAHLKISDRPSQQGAKSVTEELSFNRIYALEQGRYDVSVLAKGKADEANEIQLLGQKDYVLLRTGEGQEGTQTLVTFPHDQIQQSGATQPFGAMLVVLAAIASLFA
jgi:hypothetical protein